MNKKYFVSAREISGSVRLNLPQWIRQKIFFSELVFILRFSWVLPGVWE